ncbi:hypothetical protein GLAREA_01916 [Glarea lozoyensis ATCC 20868]|uniref:Uncharacterized protein n=1 Tax=Glarea lozoyensis (strain ATCC 20868 / MF5171) TaxID=1116229 RepID=S3CLA8_GLAL2|nr:uncharacterized protein GLAREA_01916 [Glarea lozoyensis ATCC 20868]EPE26004.1 hypothetical protein GLAREA_01916 [Glarea lozoyensis ATCC 20868]
MAILIGSFGVGLGGREEGQQRAIYKRRKKPTPVTDDDYYCTHCTDSDSTGSDTLSASPQSLDPIQRLATLIVSASGSLEVHPSVGLILCHYSPATLLSPASARV